MPFTGKATYSAGSTLPEIAEDVSDLIGIVSPFETPLLDALGDARRSHRFVEHADRADRVAEVFQRLEERATSSFLLPTGGGSGILS